MYEGLEASGCVMEANCASALHWYYVPHLLLYGHVRCTQTGAQTNKTLAVTLCDKDKTQNVTSGQIIMLSQNTY